MLGGIQISFGDLELVSVVRAASVNEFLDPDCVGVPIDGLGLKDVTSRSRAPDFVLSSKGWGRKLNLVGQLDRD